jgi:hypothetical protein
MLTPEIIVVFILIPLLIYIKKKTSKRNRHHLIYLQVHLGCIIAHLLIFNAIANNFISSKFFQLIFGLHITGLTCLLLHAQSVLLGYRVKIKFVYYTPLILLLAIYILNYLNIFILNFSTRQEQFLGLDAYDQMYFSDTFLARNLSALGLIATTIYSCIHYTSIPNNKKIIKKKKTYIFWLFTYLSIISLAIIVTSIYYFGLLNAKFDSYLYTLSRFFILLSILSFTLNPNILFLIPLITSLKTNKQTTSLGTFKIINDTMNAEKLFLLKNFETRKLCEKVDFDQKEILRALLENSKGNWKNISMACVLITP